MAILPEVINVPKLVRADRTAPDFGATGQTRLDEIELQEPELLQQIEEVAAQQIAGEIPEDVQQEVLQTTAELGISTGAAGQANEFLTAQQLGLTSLTVQQQGVETGLAVAGIQSDRELAEVQANIQVNQFDEQLNRDFASLQEETRQWEDKFLTSQQEAVINEAQVEIQLAELMSINKRFMQGMIRDVALANAKNNVPGAQQLINEWRVFFGINNLQLAQWFGLENDLRLER